ncbi:hypothetical protein BV20DRAFT_973962 [Pilatotrama ljubarskyi]|nr:hypothetical protein BV20DRAFT_973962 [Pilatotrama ljubarskyi]
MTICQSMYSSPSSARPLYTCQCTYSKRSARGDAGELPDRHRRTTTGRLASRRSPARQKSPGCILAGTEQEAQCRTPVIVCCGCRGTHFPSVSKAADKHTDVGSISSPPSSTELPLRLLSDSSAKRQRESGRPLALAQGWCGLDAVIRASHAYDSPTAYSESGQTTLRCA